MVDAKTVYVSVVALLSVFIQLGIRAQTTIGSFSEDASCSQLEEQCEFQAVENARLRSLLESERQTVKTQEEGCEFQAVENTRLRSASESKRQKIETLKNELRWLRARGLQRVSATLVGSFDHSESHYGITKVEDKIYVLDHHPNRIRVYEDLLGFRLMANIALNRSNWPYDIAYSKDSKRVFISDSGANCIWVMRTTGDHRLTKWLTNVTSPHSLSLSNEGHLLVPRGSQSFGQESLEIYSLNATLIRRLHFPHDVKYPQHVVQTSAGNFIFLHRLNNASSGQWVISQLTIDGHLIHRFIPRNQSEELKEPAHMSLDSDNNRLFVTDHGNNRVILFDSQVLTWSQVLVSQETNAIFKPFRLLYDASKKHLFVAQYYRNVTVYELS